MPTDASEPMIDVQLVENAIDLNGLWDPIADPNCGAQLVFVGRTRRATEKAAQVLLTANLSYEAFRPMAIKELQDLLYEASQKWPLRKLIGIHRIGEVQVGEASIAIALASPHRAACMEAMPWIMDQLKQRVPIWKQERFEDGAEEWVHP
ncbi:Molybdopterin synthase catalytic subunit [Roseimaritima multifibrata]|uniref:Molybdopterin synthase catalytic subunit n=1 Tax=Roseimaritima multifibrata TaxID=1930274 RepID=A0A517MCV0_9BACT|nr:molybdenum cofactor biosynthesis protein MoaE [Roseimaritima multifibrata]QDS92705.1 Molybdopterin synthase catalytic subunit [Roseimaritima multifibrata]